MNIAVYVYLFMSHLIKARHLRPCCVVNIDQMLSDLTVSDTVCVCVCVCVCVVIRDWRSPSGSAQQLANLRLWSLKAICPLFLSSTLTCALIQTHYLLKVSSCSVGMLLCVWFYYRDAQHTYMVRFSESVCLQTEILLHIPPWDFQACLSAVTAHKPQRLPQDTTGYRGIHYYTALFFSQHWEWKYWAMQHNRFKDMMFSIQICGAEFWNNEI